MVSPPYILHFIFECHGYIPDQETECSHFWQRQPVVYEENTAKDKTHSYDTEHRVRLRNKPRRRSECWWWMPFTNSQAIPRGGLIYSHCDPSVPLWEHAIIYSKLVVISQSTFVDGPVASVPDVYGGDLCRLNPAGLNDNFLMLQYSRLFHDTQ